MDQVAPYRREWASGLWRSEDMVLTQLTFQRELAHSSIHELGQLGICQFVDLNTEVSAFQREYTRDVRRCEEAERKVRSFREQLATVAHAKGRTRIRVDPHAVVDTDPPVRNLDDLDRRLQEIDERLTEKQTRYMQLLEQRNRTIQYLEILDCTGDFLRAPSSEFPVGTRSDTNLQYLTGVIQTSKLFGFERAIHRASRGNFFIRKRPIQQPLEDPKTLELVHYTVFIVFFAAQRVHDVVRKLADSIGAVVHDVPTAAAAETARIDLRAEQESHDHAQAAWEDELGALLSLVASNIDEWERRAGVEKAIAATLNLCRFSGSTAMAEAWVPKKRLRELRDALAQASHAGSAQVESLLRVIPTTRKHPTFFDTNKFTSNFQQIVDAYGIATYKEVNPGVFTIATFPFLFGIMFGDIGHGTMMFVLALLLVLLEKQLAKVDNEIFQMMFGGRYLILLMSIFSIYVGILYNDCFGLMVGSPSGQWHFNATAIDPRTGEAFSCEHFPEGHEYKELGNETVTAMQRVCVKEHGGFMSTTQPEYASNPIFGVDSAWAGATNRLDYYNSFKMKQAVIIGVVHMLAGVFHNLANRLRQGDMLRVWTMCLPELLFLTFTFGWMDLLIIVKWLKHWTNPSTSPSLLTEMTSFFLAPGSEPVCYAAPGGPELPPSDPCYGRYDPELGYWYLFPGQFYIQALLMLIAVISVPLLLCPVPCVEYFKRRDAPAANYSHQVADDEDAIPAAHGEGEGHEDHDFSEVVIHQMIHTIEFVLGCVSNTASYLRLWALSLAHAQLAEVFWEFTMKIGFETAHGTGPTAALVFCVWAVWFVVTLGVLVGMEGLSAFLHALRLHWVEFQNKFYEGEGIQFTPLAFGPPRSL